VNAARVAYPLLGTLGVRRTMQGPHEAELVRRRQIQAVATTFLRRRPLIVGPAALLMLVLLAAAGVPRTQLVALAAVKASLVGFFAWEAWHYRRRAIGYGAFFASLALTIAGLTVACALSGGIRSPIVPLLLAPSTLGLAAFGVRWPGRALLALLVSAGIVLLALPPSTTFAPPPASVAPIASAGIVLVTTLLFTAGIVGLVQAYERTGFALGEMRAEAAAEAEARSRELGTLGARLAHELRNPLAALKGLLQLEARHADSERAQRRFAVMESEMARLEAILAEYLDFTRAPSEPQPRPCSARALVREVLAVLEGRAHAAGVGLAEDGDELTLAVDGRLVKQALFNLLANGLDATPAGGQVQARVRRTTEGAVIEIADTGRGMDAQALGRVGTPFFSTRPAGTGLGVVIARRVARQHGGDLRFASQPGAGTTATLVLPIQTQEPA
jgi:signal transduction histidine kinase